MFLFKTLEKSFRKKEATVNYGENKKIVNERKIQSLWMVGENNDVEVNKQTVVKRNIFRICRREIRKLSHMTELFGM